MRSKSWGELDVSMLACGMLYAFGKASEVWSSPVATVSSKGQVTLPKTVRDALGLETGTKISFEIQADTVVLHKESPEAALRRWRGRLRSVAAGRSVDDVITEMRCE